MKAEITALVVNGILKPDTALPFPDHTRVKLMIEPVEVENPSLAAWTRLKERIDRQPIVGLVGAFSREELYERD
jgi:hypothetical protein